MISRSKKNILVTGGAGFIGSHTVEALLARGHRVLVYDNFSTGEMSNLEAVSSGQPGVLDVVEGDMRDGLRLQSLFRRFQPGVVFHLAALTSVSGSIAEPELCDEVNIGGVVNLLRAIEHYKVQKLVFASTSALYGALKPPHREDFVIHNRSYLHKLSSPYAKSKLIGESLIMEAPLASVIFRFFNVYGERQPVSGGYPAVIPSFLRDIEENGEVTIFGDGLQSRDFIYAGDVARALVEAMQPGFTGIYNLGSGRGITIHELAEVVTGLCGVEFRARYEPSRPGEIRESYGSLSRLVQNLRFSPRVDLYDGLGRLCPAAVYPLADVAVSR